MKLHKPDRYNYRHGILGFITMQIFTLVFLIGFIAYIIGGIIEKDPYLFIISFFFGLFFSLLFYIQYIWDGKNGVEF